MKEILLTSLAGLIIGIILVHYQNFIETDNNNSQSQQPVTTNLSSPPPISSSPVVEEQPKDSVTQLKALQIVNPSVSVTLWLDAPDKIQFNHDDNLKLYYKINGLNTIAYVTLFNVSPSQQLSIVLDNEAIEVGKLYSLPKSPSDWAPNQFAQQDKKLRLEKGREYFKAIVTAKPIEWLEFFQEINTTKTLPSILGIKELEVNVN